MNELRKDFLLERYSIISDARGNRPIELKPVQKPKSTRPKKNCFFCPGNEGMTPPTIERYPREGSWQIRVFKNKFPALVSPRGEHEVIVETEKHGIELQDLSIENIVEVFKTYERRRIALEKKYKYVSIFKNVGEAAGASLAHSHSQLIATPIIPSIVSLEKEASQRYYEKWHRCPWCDEIKKIDKKRVGTESENTMVMTPNAPRFPYEVWVMPKRHVGNFSELEYDESRDFCKLLKECLEKAYGLAGSYNYVVHNAPAKGSEKSYHFHVEILPRTSTHAGFEIGEGAYIISVSPENSAKLYRS